MVEGNGGGIQENGSRVKNKECSYYSRATL